MIIIEKVKKTKKIRLFKNNSGFGQMCNTGTIWNASAGTCMPIVCPPGEFYNPGSYTCQNPNASTYNPANFNQNTRLNYQTAATMAPQTVQQAAYQHRTLNFTAGAGQPTISTYNPANPVASAQRAAEAQKETEINQIQNYYTMSMGESAKSYILHIPFPVKPTNDLCSSMYNTCINNYVSVATDKCNNAINTPGNTLLTPAGISPSQISCNFDTSKFYSYKDMCNDPGQKMCQSYIPPSNAIDCTVVSTGNKGEYVVTFKNYTAKFTLSDNLSDNSVQGAYIIPAQCTNSGYDCYNLVLPWIIYNTPADIDFLIKAGNDPNTGQSYVSENTLMIPISIPQTQVCPTPPTGSIQLNPSTFLYTGESGTNYQYNITLPNGNSTSLFLSSQLTQDQINCIYANPISCTDDSTKQCYNIIITGVNFAIDKYAYQTEPGNQSIPMSTTITQAQTVSTPISSNPALTGNVIASSNLTAQSLTSLTPQNSLIPSTPSTPLTPEEQTQQGILIPSQTTEQIITAPTPTINTSQPPTVVKKKTGIGLIIGAIAGGVIGGPIGAITGGFIGNIL